MSCAKTTRMAHSTRIVHRPDRRKRTGEDQKQKDRQSRNGVSEAEISGGSEHSADRTTGDEAGVVEKVQTGEHDLGGVRLQAARGGPTERGQRGDGAPFQTCRGAGERAARITRQSYQGSGGDKRHSK